MVQEGYAVDLFPYIEEDEEFAQNTSSVILDNWKTKDGKLYTVSDVLLMGGYWYNQDIFEKNGRFLTKQTEKILQLFSAEVRKNA